VSKNIYSTPVPYEGPESYNIMCVGEAPGGVEVGQGRPFVGKTGDLLERYFLRKPNRIPRKDIMLANLSKYRPRGNNFRLLLDTEELEQGLVDLETEILKAKPNVIVALGNWPMWFLTGECGYDTKRRKNIPGTGISDFRGSRFPSLSQFGGGKVFCSYHPSAIERVWSRNPIFFIDIEHAVEDSLFPELRYTDYEEHIDPPADILDELLKETLVAEWCSTDIETFPGGSFSCVGWAFKHDGRFKAVTVTYQREDLWKYAREMWISDVPKILQYGTYDISFMDYFYSWKIGGYYGNVGWDTYVASASLLPDYPRRLDFLCSIHTRFPFYKNDRKVWKKLGDMNILWRYNLKDCVATYEVAEKQMEEMKDLFRRVA